jgi:acetyl esterase
MTRLDPQARSLLEAMNASGQPPLFTLPVAAARRARRRQLVVDPPRAAIATVEDDLVPGPLGGIPLRWYRPGREGGLPVTLYFHGGGYSSRSSHGHQLPTAARLIRRVLGMASHRP